jgi:Xaa-Pro aminopeptidase
MSVDSNVSRMTSESEAVIARRREAAQRRWDLNDQVVVIGAGEPIHQPGRADLTYPFRPHSEYVYLTDSQRSGGVLAFDPAEGWTDFIRPVSTAERLWEGAPPGQPPGRPVDELESWLAERSGRPVAALGVVPDAVLPDEALSTELRRGLNEVRRPKDALEVERMRAAERATRAGFEILAGLLAPGKTERELQIELEAGFARAGGDALAFETIVASGPNSAVLHFPPTGRALEAGELVLVDAGAEYRNYASDVTRTYVVSGGLSGEQRLVYELVRRALDAGVERCRPGTGFRDVHLAGARVIAEGLIELGVLRGEPDDLVEQGAVSVFFPHGIGHLVGLGVRDASEVRGGAEAHPATPGLRSNLTLAPGWATTVEPGVYFVEALIRDPERRAKVGDAVDWDRAEALIGFGGVRLEHNVLITEDAPEVLTANIPL